MQTAATLAAFLAVEWVIHSIEHWWNHKEHHFRAARHAAIIAWCCHPATSSAVAEWINHLLATAIHATGH